MNRNYEHLKQKIGEKYYRPTEDSEGSYVVHLPSIPNSWGYKQYVLYYDSSANMNAIWINESISPNKLLKRSLYTDIGIYQRKYRHFI
jgi:hypothetical protein